MINPERKNMADKTGEQHSHDSTLTARMVLTILFLNIILLSGCSRFAPPTPTTVPSNLAAQISIVSVQIEDQGNIFAGGDTSLPDEACIKTELLADGAAMAWWPRDFCAAASAGKWGILVPLGLNGAPQKLQKGVQYELRAWWPDTPEETLTRFPFDLDGPLSPDQ
jgi:uncharacterized lipoprotein YbaY